MCKLIKFALTQPILSCSPAADSILMFLCSFHYRVWNWGDPNGPHFPTGEEQGTSHSYELVKSVLLQVSVEYLSQKQLGPAHRYRLEIPDPVPSLSWHGLQLWVFRFFHDQNNCDSSGVYVLQSEHEDKHVWNAAWRMKIMDAFCFTLISTCVVGKTQIPPIGVLWLKMPLHGVV